MQYLFITQNMINIIVHSKFVLCNLKGSPLRTFVKDTHERFIELYTCTWIMLDVCRNKCNQSHTER